MAAFMGFPCSLFLSFLDRNCHFLIKNCSTTFLFSKVSVDFFKQCNALQIEETTNLTIKSQMKSDLGFDDKVKGDHPVSNISLKAEYIEKQQTQSTHFIE